MNPTPLPNPAMSSDSAFRNPQSAIRAWCVLVVQSFQRHWRVRQMGWVSAGLLGILVAWVAVITERGGWDMANQRARRSSGSNREEAERLTPRNRYLALGDEEKANELQPHEVPNPLNPTEDALRSLILSVPQAVINADKLRREWAFMTFSRWVIYFAFFGYVLPMFTLSYASGAFGTDRESRSLVWLMTRPIPRSGIYLAKFVGTLPWCLAFGVGGFAAVCLAGGRHRPRSARPLLARRGDGDGRVRVAVPPRRRNPPPAGRRRVGVRVLLRNARIGAAGQPEVIQPDLLRAVVDV